MSLLKQLKSDYKVTWEAYKYAREQGDTKAMQRNAHELSQLAEQMEMEE